MPRISTARTAVLNRRKRKKVRRLHKAASLVLYNRPPGIYRFKRWTSSTALNTSGNFNYSLTDTTAEELSLDTPFITYNVGTGGTAGGAHYASVAMKFTLGDLNDVTDFTTLFDLYRIRSVKVMLIPVLQQGLSAASGIDAQADGYVNCIVHNCLDYDDNTQFVASEAGVLAMMQYQNYKVKGLGVGSKPLLYRKFKPRALSVIQSQDAGTTVRGLAPKNTWLDCASTLIPHFGLKWILEVHIGNPATLNYAIQFRMVCCYDIEFKTVR